MVAPNHGASSRQLQATEPGATAPTLVVIGWVSIRRNTLLGFVDITLRNSLTIRGCGVHLRNGRV